MPIDIRKAKGRPKQVQLLNIADFTGGLNLNTDTFKLAPNESPDMLNVDVDQRGGFQLRKGVARINTTAMNHAPVSAWEYTTASGTRYVMVHTDTGFLNPGDVYYSTGGNFTSLAISNYNIPVRRAAVMDNKVYMTSYAVAGTTQYKWDGTTLTAMNASAPTWQNDFTAPTGTYLPMAKCIAVHSNYMWVANTRENGTAYPSRVRWSHPGRPEDWRLNDYINIDVGKDTDEITALVPMRDHILVFKRKSVHAIFGYDFNSFQVVTVSEDVGAESQEAVVSTPQGVYFFDRDHGVFVYEGRGAPKWVFEPIFPALRDGTIPKTYINRVHLGWVNKRLWLSVPYGTTATDRTHTFVYDPVVGKRGAWMLYDLPMGPFTTALNGRFFSGVRPGGANAGWVVELDAATAAAYDNFSGTNVHITSRWRSPWFDASQPAVKKRWRRMEAVLQGGVVGDITVQVYTDYDQSAVVKEFFLSATGSGSNGIWDTSNWDSAAWARSNTVYDVIDQGSSFGIARSVSLVFNGPPTNVQWGVDGFTLKYIPRKVR